MKIINHGQNFEIYPDDLKTFDLLPANTYKVSFHPMSGFSLVKIDNFETIEEKIYGNHMEKIDKILNSYKLSDRSFGVILSGDKGIGKSLSVQILASEAIKHGMPVIMVTKAYPGVAEFIDKINQEVLVIFDEFEKVFPLESENQESQNDLLGLFDGTSQKKRLYAITVNKLHKVSEFMVSRTGRFHYHIRFEYPNAKEIEMYLKDKLNPSFYGQIKAVISFASRVKLNYDSLRAIAFELNQGYSFTSAIGDLNILATDPHTYDINVLFSNGKTETFKNYQLNLFDEFIELQGSTSFGGWFTMKFKTESIKSDLFKMVIDGQFVEIDFDDEETEEALSVTSISISHHKSASINYNLAY